MRGESSVEISSSVRPDRKSFFDVAGSIVLGSTIERAKVGGPIVESSWTARYVLV
jgi:hypothetical protein